MNPTSSNFDLMARLLDVASLRHKVIAQNVANVNTPGYHQLDVSFEDSFARALSQDGESAALGTVKPAIVEGVGGAERADGNNVDIDVEMAQLEKNTLLYRTFMQLLASDIATRRTAITGQ
jgi:flagellar basal-body rod protein FlgB